MVPTKPTYDDEKEKTQKNVSLSTAKENYLTSPPISVGHINIIQHNIVLHSFILNSVHPHWPSQGARRTPPRAEDAATDRRRRGTTANLIAAGAPPKK